MRYDLTDDDRTRLDNNFAYHAPQPDQIDRYQFIRDTAKQFAMSIMELCPLSRERSLALTKLEEVVMWSNAAIARNE